MYILYVCRKKKNMNNKNLDASTTLASLVSLKTSASLSSHFARPINYITCSWDAVLLFMILLFFIGILLICLNLLVYSQYYEHNTHCYPVMYFFGQKEGCRQTISSYAQVHAMKQKFSTKPIDTRHLITQRPKRDACGKPEQFDNNYQHTGILDSLQSGFSQFWDSYLNILEYFIKTIKDINYKLFVEFLYPIF